MAVNIASLRSLSSRRAWIEILEALIIARAFGRSPHGERGLKYFDTRPFERVRACRSPHGERGLKLATILTYLVRE